MKKTRFTIMIVLLMLCVLVMLTACGGQESNTNDTNDTRPKLSLTTNIEGAGTVTGGGHFDYNEDLFINAETNSGYYFLGWYYNNDLLSTSAEYNCKMWDKDVTLEAKFTALPEDYDPSNGGMSADQLLNQKYALEVKAGMPNYGKISVDDSDNKNLYTASEKSGTNVKALALTTSSKRFLGWFDEADNLVMANAVFNFVMPCFDYTLTAKWECNEPDLQFNSDDTFVCTNCGGDHNLYKIETIGGSKVLVKYNGNSSDVVIPDVIEIIGDRAFMNSSIKNITFPDSVTSIGEAAFYGCDNLTIVTIGNGVQTIGDEAFANCPSISKINIGSSLNEIGNHAFSGCSNLTSIVVDSNNESYNSSGNCIVDTEKKELVLGCKNSTIPEDGSVISIGNDAFDGCTGLTSIAIPNSVTSIGDYAFNNCTGLTSVTIGNSVTGIGYSAFYNCTSLTSVTIGNSVTSIEYAAFWGCASLTSVNYLGTIEQWCNIYFGSGESNPLSYANNLYHNGELVTKLVIPDSVTSIGDYAFYYCKNLTSVTIPDSVTSIGDYAFYSTSLTSVTIPDSVTSIGSCAFSNCYSLTSVTIGNGVKSIGKSAFGYCINLTIIRYRGTESQWNAISNGTDWNDYTGNYTITYNYSGK